MGKKKKKKVKAGGKSQKLGYATAQFQRDV